MFIHRFKRSGLFKLSLIVPNERNKMRRKLAGTQSVATQSRKWNYFDKIENSFYPKCNLHAILLTVIIFLNHKSFTAT